MTRQSLWSVAALGAVIASLSGAGVVAVFTDTATTGTNSATSADQPALEIATASRSAGTITCASFASDLTTGLFALTDLSNSNPGALADICLRSGLPNTSFALSASAIDLVDTETACTPDEQSVDTSCGTGDGELSQVLGVSFTRWSSCTVSGSLSNQEYLLSELAAATAADLGTLNFTTICLSVQVALSLNATAEQRVAAAKDQTTWRFAFTATEAP